MEMNKKNVIDFVFTLDRKICSAEWVKAVQKKERISFVTLTEEGTYEKEQMTIQELVEKPFFINRTGSCVSI